MLSVSTLQEAIAFLSERTGRQWTDSELFDLATTFEIPLRASVPIEVGTTAHVLEDDGRRLKPKLQIGDWHSPLAILFPKQVKQLWLCGETTTQCPANFNQVPGEYRSLNEPVRVTAADVRIEADTLTLILRRFEHEQERRRKYAESIAPDTEQTEALATAPDDRMTPAERRKDHDLETAPQPIAIRITKLRAILQHFIDSGVAPAIEAIWVHIGAHAGKDNFEFSTRSVDKAVYVGGETVLKSKIERTLSEMRKTKTRQNNNPG